MLIGSLYGKWGKLNIFVMILRKFVNVLKYNYICIIKIFNIYGYKIFKIVSSIFEF